MAYAHRKTMRKSRPARRTYKRRAPALALKTRPKRVRVARKSRVDKIARQVRSLQIAKYGAPQCQRQSFRSTVAGWGVTFRLEATKPVAFCQEAISINNQMYSTDQDSISGDYSVTAIGSWVQQPFPPTVDLAANSRYDLQLYRNQKNLGVSPTYLIRGCAYDIQMFVNGFNGFVQCYEITCNSQVTRAVDQDYKLPFSLPSFVNMCKGSDTLYDQSSQFFKIKHKWTEYFNTTPDSTSNQALHTNNLRTRRMYKSYGRGRLITGTSATVNSVTQQDIATKKQSWLLFTSSNNTQDANSYVRLQVQRNIYWRDAEGMK